MTSKNKKETAKEISNEQTKALIWWINKRFDSLEAEINFIKQDVRDIKIKVTKD